MTASEIQPPFARHNRRTNKGNRPESARSEIAESGWYVEPLQSPIRVYDRFTKAEPQCRAESVI